MASVSEELRSRSALPKYVARVLDELPHETHPMTQLATGILALQVRGSQLSAGARNRGIACAKPSASSQGSTPGRRKGLP